MRVAQAQFGNAAGGALVASQHGARPAVPRPGAFPSFRATLAPGEGNRDQCGPWLEVAR